MIITAGKFKGCKVEAPDEKITRPTLSKVRMSVFNTLQSMINFEGASFLDMYAGSGIMGLEALSRGFTKVVAIEKNPKSAKILKENYNKIEGRRFGRQEGKLFNDNSLTSIYQDFYTSILTGDCLKILQKTDEKFDVVYIDPPYFSGVYEQSLDVIKNVAEGIVILEHVTDVNFKEYNVIKQKKYGDKFITFLEIIKY